MGLALKGLTKYEIWKPYMVIKKFPPKLLITGNSSDSVKKKLTTSCKFSLVNDYNIDKK